MIAAGLLLSAAAGAQQWAAPVRTEQWSTSPGQPSAAPAMPGQGQDQPSAGGGASATTSEPVPGVACARGSRIELLQAGTWYPATVLDGPDRMGTCLVSHDGYGSNWDEWVNAARMRPSARSAAAAPRPENGPPAQAPGTAAGKLPAGSYACYTFDAGQLNYTHTDIVVQEDGRYRVGGRKGRYTLAANGALAFTGPLDNATGTLASKGGRPQIELVFNGDARSSRACARAR
ncbi:hypothetical protein SH611_11795 [Geminicoccaceae bacterium 1502E]|nr:hypothetical protein [Geminicoccaceae bacterium 1502E]